jgi:hypothetical protein
MPRQVVSDEGHGPETRELQPAPIWKIWVAVAALAFLFGMIEAAQLRFGSGALGRPMAFRLAMMRVLPYWGVFAPLMPLVAIIVRRFQGVSSIVKPTLPHLFVTAVGFALIVLGGRMLIPVVDANGVRLQQSARQLFQTYFVLDVLTYTAVVGTLYAFHYYREARNRELMASRLEASLTEASLKGLEARIDPAFLFSTLDKISTLARRGEQKAVVDTLSRLSELLRAALNDEQTEEVALTTEIETLPTEWAPAVEYVVEPDAFAALVPRGVLHPLIEYALRHRPAQSAGPRRISVLAAKHGDDALTVEVGEASHWVTAPSSELDAIHQRVASLYGRGYGVEMSEAPRGSRIALTIPWRVALDGEAQPPHVALA